MNVMVTGGAGFIGSHVVDLLIEYGHKVVVIDNLVNGDKANINSEAVFYNIDISQAELQHVMEAEKPDVIIHHAALTNIQKSLEDPISDGMSNVIGTLNVLHSAVKNHVKKIIYASTCAVYGDQKLKVIKEDSKLSPISFYGSSKLMAGVYIALYNSLFDLDYTILRYANVFGPRQKCNGEGGVIGLFIDCLKKGTKPIIFGDGRQTRDFVYVKDIAKANVLALTKASGQIINIGSGVSININELYSILCKNMNSKLAAESMPERQGEIKHMNLDISKAAKELNWNAACSIEEGLHKTIEFYCSNHGNCIIEQEV